MSGKGHRELGGHARPLSAPKFLALDLDGTLIGADLKIRPAVKTAIERARKQNVAGCIVTGRMHRATVPFAVELDFAAPMICYQGAGIFERFSGAVLRETPLSNIITLQVTRAAKREGLHVQLYSGDNYFVEEQNWCTALYAKLSGVEPIIVDSLEESFARRESIKIVVVVEANLAAGYLPRIRELCGPNAYITRSYPEFIEILSPAVNKGEALEFVCARLGVSLKDVVAIGDSWNDVPLLNVAGFGIAMGSAPPELAARADAVVADVANDGVAEAIERFVLQ
ncbi:MAG: HAD family hydrolase [Candidatus Eremiobacteraeota bacterium]|nr:HAD family hydrolase [Candidatus Eremiobacteraeota bacterium]